MARPALAERVVESSGVLSGGVFGISTKDQAHILNILRDKLYTNKILAVLREYSTNAWDAHREVGKHDVPVEVTLPTELESTLLIRDYGPGLSEDDIYNTYVKYGASTKRDSNDQVGMLGIGAKSAFCYSDSFTVTSHHGGKKTVYVAVLDVTNVGIISKLYEEDSDETGIEIKVPVNPGDVAAFAYEASKLFPYFRPQPRLNIKLAAKVTTWRSSGFVRKRTSGETPEWYAVMGCVPYRLDFGQIFRGTDEIQICKRMHGGISFDIGEADVSANREDLEYTDRTRRAVLERLTLLEGEVWGEAEAEVMALTTPWERRLRIRALVQELGTSPRTGAGSEALIALQNANVYLPSAVGPAMEPTTFRMVNVEIEWTQRTRKRKSARTCLNHGVVVDPSTRLLVLDVTTPLHRFNYGGHDRVVIPSPREVPVNVVMSELRVQLEEAGLTGIPIHLMSSQPVVVEEGGWGRPPNSKYSKRCFIMTPSWFVKGHRKNKRSDAWDVTDSVPEPDNCAVILNGFEAVSEDRNFYTWTHTDFEALNNAFALPAEEFVIYGIKTTVKKPVHTADIKAKRYVDWILGLITAGLQKHPELLDVFEGERLRQRDADSWSASAPRIMHYLFDNLGSPHALTDYVEAVTRHGRRVVADDPTLSAAAKRTQEDLLRKSTSAVQYLCRRIPDAFWTANTIGLHDIYLSKKVLLQQYPLLFDQYGGPGLEIFRSDHADFWLDYVYRVDAHQGKTA